jgi:hypothetical protein
VTSDYRLGVHDDHAGGETFWYDMESADTTYTVWWMLRDYARAGIGVTVQVRGTDGEWKTVTPALLTRPHDWPPD